MDSNKRFFPADKMSAPSVEPSPRVFSSSDFSLQPRGGVGASAPLEGGTSTPSFHHLRQIGLGILSDPRNLSSSDCVSQPRGDVGSFAPVEGGTSTPSFHHLRQIGIGILSDPRNLSSSDLGSQPRGGVGASAPLEGGASTPSFHHLRQIKIGTRGSALALWQANFIASELRRIASTVEIELVRISTKGDRILDSPLSKIGGKGIFTRELETAMLDGRIDLAVHSLKDVPVELPSEFVIAAVTERADPLDAFVSNRYDSIEELPRGARVGTSSLRRRAQLLALRSDLTVEDLRGNVDTRLRRLDEGKFDAIILAAAGLKRLGHGGRIRAELEPSVMMPAVGQGALAIEVARSNRDVLELVSMLDDRTSRLTVEAERSFLRVVEGGCQVPVGVHATIVGNEITVEGLIASLDGGRIIRDSTVGTIEEAERLGAALAQRLLDDGGRDILRGIQS